MTVAERSNDVVALSISLLLLHMESRETLPQPLLDKHRSRVWVRQDGVRPGPFPARESPVNNRPHGTELDFHIGCESVEPQGLGLGFTLLGSQSFGG